MTRSTPRLGSRCKSVVVGWHSGIEHGSLQHRFTDLQVSIFVPATGQFITDNAAEAHTRGIEIDGRWAVTDSFSLGFSGSYGEAEYDEYDGASCNSLDAKQAVIDAGGNPMAPCFIDGAGKRLPFSSDWSLKSTTGISCELGRLTADGQCKFHYQ